MWPLPTQQHGVVLPSWDRFPPKHYPTCEARSRVRVQAGPQDSIFMQADHGIPRCLTQAQPNQPAGVGVVTTRQTTEATSSPKSSSQPRLSIQAGVWWPRAPSILQAHLGGNPPTDRATIAVGLLLSAISYQRGSKICYNKQCLSSCTWQWTHTGQHWMGLPTDEAEEMPVARQTASSVMQQQLKAARFGQEKGGGG